MAAWSNFLVSSMAWRGVEHAVAVEKVKKEGFAGVELLCERGYFEIESDSDFKEMKKALGCWPEAKITLHLPYETIDLSCSSPGLLEESIRSAQSVLKRGLQLGARVFILHVRSLMKINEWGQGNLAALERSLSRLMAIAAPQDARLAIENVPPRGFTSDEGDLLDLLESYPPVVIGACIDVGHAFLADTLMDYAHLLASRAFCLHLHDNSGTGTDEHLPPGKGAIPWQELVDALKSREFGGRVVLEVRSSGSFDETLGELKRAVTELRLDRLG